MCSTPSTPAVTSSNNEKVAAPTYADAQVTKATSNTRNKVAALAGRDIKTTSRGLSDEAVKEKKNLLGG